MVLVGDCGQYPKSSPSIKRTVFNFDKSKKWKCFQITNTGKTARRSAEKGRLFMHEMCVFDKNSAPPTRIFCPTRPDMGPEITNAAAIT